MNQHPMNWLPRPGESKHIPGGIIWCEKWEVNDDGQMITGAIVLRFQLRTVKDGELNPESLADIMNEEARR